MKRWLALLFIVMAAGTVDADIDESAYEAGGALSSPREQRRMRERIAAEIEAEHRRAALQAEARERTRAEAAAREAARPYPERLTAQRCTGCHASDHFENQRHTWLGWRVVVARMVWLNGAPIEAREQSVIAGHLTATHPPDVETRILEYGLPPALVTAIAGVVFAGCHLLRRRPAPHVGMNRC